MRRLVALSLLEQQQRSAGEPGEGVSWACQPASPKLGPDPNNDLVTDIIYDAPYDSRIGMPQSAGIDRPAHSPALLFAGF
jgi:hypothetical protein